LVSPAALPATLLLLGFPMNVFMAWRERSSVDWEGLTSILGGRIIGAALGVWLLVAIPTDWLSTFYGILILAAVVMSAAHPAFAEVQPRPGLRLAAGVASGLMSTGAAVGGPALVLLYQNRPGPEMRGTLAVSFLLGVVMSLGALAIAGRITNAQVVLSAKLLPALLLGLIASRHVARLLDRRALRPAILAFAFVSASAAVAEGILH
jgi:uncharacterized membrane protein YfcA